MYWTWLATPMWRLSTWPAPHQFHAQHTEIAAAHGKHVLVEKPMALNAADCDRMIAACRAANVHLIVGHCHSFDTPYLRTRNLIRSGDFGAVKMIQAFNYTDYLYRPRRPEELMTAEGGGAVFSQAAHQVDIVRLLAGSRATRLRASVGRWGLQAPDRRRVFGTDLVREWRLCLALIQWVWPLQQRRMDGLDRRDG